jgi:hypothetical protein
MIGTGIGLGLAGYRINPAGMMLPVLDINFRDVKTFSSTIGPTASFSRASSGTYFDETGVLRTASTNVGRINHVHDGTGWVCKGGLIEEQRTNLAPYSEQINDASWGFTTNITISANAATAPDGATTADLMYPTASSTLCETGKSVGSVNTSLIYTNSFFLKASGKTWARILSIRGDFGAWFNLSNGTVGTTLSGSTATIQNVGNGWYRCSVTRGTDLGTGYTFIRVSDGDNTSAITKNGTDGILVWGAQSEQGSFSTSYIPTTTAAVTRSADVCQITGSDFSGFWNASESSFAVEYDVVSTTPAVTAVFYANDGTVNNSFRMYANSGAGATEFYSRAASVTDGIITLTASAPYFAKIATGQKLNDFAGSINGAAVATDTSVAMPTGINRLDFGVDHVGSRMNGHIARLRYYNTRLTNSQLQGLTL